ncbi:hypothetical protein M0802_000207 [Mischocyttarus mexicanus]|nr:hypothetical protein M0802_000207 [Mischocyttarus mexicanus]
MRVHCDNTEPVVHWPSLQEMQEQQQQQQQQQQQHQHQQQTIIEEQQQPHHTLTTPAWGNSDTTAQKEETSDDKNDSVMSPGDYISNPASPMSGSFSVANCSLSPESTSSHDSNQLFNQCRISNNLNPTDDSNGVSNDGTLEESFECPVCKTIIANKDSFSEHLISHYGRRNENLEAGRNKMNSPVPGPFGLNRRRGSRNRREQSENQETEEPGLRVPRVNSQGRLKTFRCKQCQFTAVTKLEFWTHSRVHIRPDKLLACPNCPFVTEYKHHLEYHLRNHYGSKPFKCDKCTYTCVNKSMLNSHLKSHSNIYQYRCAECIYATKYCHSLKLHLRKYTHLPAMVLNADGTPNPLPIIDIYGTRRGPKNKSKTQKTCTKNTRVNRGNRSGNGRRSSQQETTVTTTQTSNTNSLESSMNLAIPGPSTSNLVNGVNGITNGLTNGTVNDANTVNCPPLLAYNPVLTDLSVSNENHNEETEERLVPLDLSTRESLNFNGNTNGNDQSRKRLLPATKTKGTSRRKGKAYKLDRRQVISENESDEITTSESQRHTESFARSESIENNTRKHQSKGSTKNNKPKSRSDNLQQEDPSVNHQPESCLKNHQSEESSKNPQSEDYSKNHKEEDPKENHQLEGSLKNHQSDGPWENYQQGGRLENQKDGRLENYKLGDNELNYLKQLSYYSIDHKLPLYMHDPYAAANSLSHICSFCEIAFSNVIMHKAHMSFHTATNPYICKKCGLKCEDKVEFFLHVEHSEHKL